MLFPGRCSDELEASGWDMSGYLTSRAQSISAMQQGSPLAPTTTHAKEIAFLFESLPTEVRFMVYKYYLPIGKKVALKSTTCDKEGVEAGVCRAVPFPALLQVNSKIRAEAAPIYYRENTWRIDDAPKGLRLPRLFSKHVHKATVSFDRSTINIDTIWKVSNDVFENVAPASQRLRVIHDELKQDLLTTWERKCKTVANLDLKELTVDFEQCKCPLGCCRLVEDVVELLYESVTLEEDGKINVTGLLFEQEATFVHVRDFRCDACHKGPEEDAADAGYCWRSLPDEPE